MYIHIGSRIVVSDKSIVGIFNLETLKKSADNEFFVTNTGADDKSIIVDVKNRITPSIVSPFTIIKRTQMNEIRRENEE